MPHMLGRVAIRLAHVHSCITMVGVRDGPLFGPSDSHEATSSKRRQTGIEEHEDPVMDISRGVKVCSVSP